MRFFSKNKKKVAGAIALVLAVVMVLGSVMAGFADASVGDSSLATQGVVDVERMQAPVDSNMTVYNATGVVNATTVNVRSGPSTQYSKIGVVTKNKTVTIVGKFSSGTWYKIVYGNGYGYMSGQYLSNIKLSSNADAGMIAFSGTAKTTANLNVRSGSGTGYAQIGRFTSGSAVTLVGKFANEWYKVVYSTGYGYVSGDYLKNISSGSTTTTTTQPNDYTPFSATGKTTGNLNVRNGNGTNYAIIGLISSGSTVKIVGEYSNGWYRVVFGSGYGCVSKKYVANVVSDSVTTTTASTTATTTSTTLTTSSTTVAPTTVTTTTVTTTQGGSQNGEVPFNAVGVTTDPLNVRVGPDVKYTRLGVLSKGTKITIVAKTDTNWYKIIYGSNYGYVSCPYVTGVTEQTTTTTTETTTQVSETDKGLHEFFGTGVTTASLNFREGPSTAYKKILVIPSGAKVDIVGYVITDSNQTWYKIQYSGYYGYVSGDYLKDIKDAEGSQIVTGPTQIVEIIEDDAMAMNAQLTASSIYKEYSPQNCYLPVGTKDYLVRAYSKYGSEFYELASGINVLKSKTKLYSGEGMGANTMSAQSVSTGDKTIFTISTDWNVPFKTTLAPQAYSKGISGEYSYNVSAFTAEYIDFKFAYTTQVQGTFNVSGSSVIKSANWIKNADGTHTLRLTFKNAGAFYGYNTAYENGSFILSVREVAKPQPANNAYGYTLNGVRVWIDAGHGANDSGAVGYQKKAYEKDLNLAIAKKLRDELKALGATVGMTRQDDTFYELTDRVRMAENFDADIFISVHHDYYSSTTASGTSAFYYQSYSYDLAKSVHDEIVSAYKNSVYNDGTSASKQNLSRVDRGTQQNVFAVTRGDRFASILIEYGFVSNAHELSKLMQDGVQLNLAKATARGIINSLK